MQLKSNGQRAVIAKINADKSAMVEFDDKSTKTFQASELAMVAPTCSDRVCVTGGLNSGLEGNLVSQLGKSVVMARLHSTRFANSSYTIFAGCDDFLCRMMQVMTRSSKWII